jgi:hypothetical protein
MARAAFFPITDVAWLDAAFSTATVAVGVIAVVTVFVNPFAVSVPIREKIAVAACIKCAAFTLEAEVSRVEDALRRTAVARCGIAIVTLLRPSPEAVPAD